MADNAAANLRQPKTVEDAIAEIRAKADERKLDSFKVKVQRQSGLGSPPSYIASFEEATVAMLASPEQWIPAICGGGPIFLLSVTHAEEDIPCSSFRLPAINGAPKTIDPAITRDPAWRGPPVLTYPAPALGEKKPEQNGALDAINQVRQFLGVPAPQTETSGTRGQDASRSGGGDPGVSHAQRQLETLQLVSAFERMVGEIQKGSDRQLGEIRELVKSLATKPEAAPQKSLAEQIVALAPLLSTVAPLVVQLLSSGKEREAAMLSAMEKNRDETLKLLMTMQEKSANATGETTKMLNPLIEALTATSRLTLQNVATMRELQSGEQQPSEWEGLLRAGAGALGEYMAAKEAARAGRPPQRQLPPGPQRPQGQGQGQAPAEQEQGEGEAEGSDDAAELEYLKSAAPDEILKLTVDAIRREAPAEDIVSSFIRAMQVNPGVVQLVKEAGGPLPLFRKAINDDNWLRAHMPYVGGLVAKFNEAAKAAGGEA